MHRKFCFLVCLLLLLPLLFSCGRSKRFLECLDGEFVCLVRGEVSGKPFSATLDSSGRAVYAAPESVRGVVAALDGETLTQGELRLPAASLVGLFLPAGLLCEDYEVSGSGTDQGECYVDGANAHGHRRVYVAADGTPCRVVGEWRGVHADFEITEFKTENLP